MDIDPVSLPTDWWKHGGVKIEFQQTNPKQAKSKAWARYERYKTTTTVAAAIAVGALPEDLRGDYAKKYLSITSVDAAAGTAQRTVKRDLLSPGAAASMPQRTPQRARTVHHNIMSTEVTDDSPLGTHRPCGNCREPGCQYCFTSEAAAPAEHTQVNQPPDGVVTLRAMQEMMRETMRAEMAEWKATFQSTMSEFRSALDGVRQDLVHEKMQREREQRNLMERVARLEEQMAGGRASDGTRDSNIEDKLTLVVGGFGTVPKEVALETVSKALDEIAGFVEAYATSEVPSVVFAKFDSEESLTTFLKHQGEHEGFTVEGLHAGRPKPREERRRQRALNKIKRAVCEVTQAESKAVRLDRRSMKAYRVDGRMAVEIAHVGQDASIKWSQDALPAVKARAEELLTE